MALFQAALFRRALLLLSGTAFFALPFLGATAGTPGDADPSTIAPPYEARELGLNSRVSLSALRGNVVLLNTWATWCAPCLQELPAFGRAQRRHRAAGLVVVAVNIDEGTSDERVLQYAQGLRLRFTIWRDPTNRFARTFDVSGVPDTLLIDRTGRIVKRWIGPMDPTSTENAQLIITTLTKHADADDQNRPDQTGFKEGEP